jgi:hypothetical protein
MVECPMQKSKKPEIDLRPDGWERFERAVDIAVTTPAKHRAARKRHPASKGRIRKGKRPA